MLKTYFGFALADSMFNGDCLISRLVLSPEQAMEVIEGGIIPCLNPSHVASIDAMRTRFGISVEIPPAPPQVTLGVGDAVLVMGIRGLPRLTDRHEYTAEEVSKATFSFTLYVVKGTNTVLDDHGNMFEE